MSVFCVFHQPIKGLWCFCFSFSLGCERCEADGEKPALPWANSYGTAVVCLQSEVCVPSKPKPAAYGPPFFIPVLLFRLFMKKLFWCTSWLYSLCMTAVLISVPHFPVTWNRK